MATNDSPDVCPACRHNGSTTIERVPIAAIAECWAREHCHAADATADSLRTDILADLGVDEVEVRRCSQCGVEHFHPRRSWSADHYPLANDELGFDQLWALEELSNSPQWMLLDIGCGDGKFLEQAACRGHLVVGLDFSAADIAVVREKRIHAVVADVHHLAAALVDEPRFDVITMFQVIEHLIDPDAVFEQLAAVSSINARLWIGCPAPHRFSRYCHHPQPLEGCDFWDYPPQHTLRWTEAGIKKLLGRHGWTVDQVHYEPLSVLGGAATMTALHAKANGWAPRSFRRRIHLLRWYAWILLQSIMTKVTGTRMVFSARRVEQSVPISETPADG